MKLLQQQQNQAANPTATQAQSNVNQLISNLNLQTQPNLADPTVPSINLPT